MLHRFASNPWGLPNVIVGFGLMKWIHFSSQCVFLAICSEILCIISYFYNLLCCM